MIHTVYVCRFVPSRFDQSGWFNNIFTITSAKNVLTWHWGPLASQLWITQLWGDYYLLVQYFELMGVRPDTLARVNVHCSNFRDMTYVDTLNSAVTMELMFPLSPLPSLQMRCSSSCTSRPSPAPQNCLMWWSLRTPVALPMNSRCSDSRGSKRALEGRMEVVGVCGLTAMKT